jgi:O-succinylbenzoate synthase
MSVKSKPSTSRHTDGSNGWADWVLTRARIGLVPPLPVNDVAVVRLPLRAPFRRLREREVAIWRGEQGWVEFAPFVEYDDAAAVPWLRAALEAATTPAPRPLRHLVPVNATVPAVPAADVPAVLALYPGCTTAKVKVAEHGQDERDDLARLEAVRDVLGPAGRLRIDVNGRWSLDAALRLLPVYERAAAGLEYVEQPCADLDDLAALRGRVDVPVAVDESVRLGRDPRLAARVADVVVLKVAPLGGVVPALRLAEQLDRPVVVSSALDSSVGLARGLALAAALPDLPYACGLGTGALLAEDVTDDPLLPVDGQVAVRPVTVSPQRLAALAAPSARAAWWRSRLERVGEVVR